MKKPNKKNDHSKKKSKRKDRQDKKKGKGSKEKHEIISEQPMNNDDSLNFNEAMDSNSDGYESL